MPLFAGVELPILVNSSYTVISSLPLACEGPVVGTNAFPLGARWYGSLSAVLNDGQRIYVLDRPVSPSLDRFERLPEQDPKLSL